MSETQNLRTLAAEVAAEVGEFLRLARDRGVSIAATKSTDLDIVTRADREAEALIRERLLAARPGDGFLGEEGTLIAGSSGITWIVDPLDGTVNYLYRCGPYAVSIAAVSGEPTPESWVVRAAAVHVCTENATYSAGLGEGATREDAPLAVTAGVPLRAALVSTGLGYDRGRRAEQARAAALIAPRVRDLRMGGSAATDLCLVAAGRLDAYFERDLAPWDYAAGALIVAEAGGLTLGEGATPDGVLTLAAAPGLAGELRELVAEATGS